LSNKLNNAFAVTLIAVSFLLVGSMSAQAEGLASGGVFTHCDYCPEMVVVPAVNIDRPEAKPMPTDWRRRPVSCIALSLNPSLNTPHVSVRRPLGSGVATMPKPKPELSY